MAFDKKLSVFRVEDEAGREKALSVLRPIYRDEKQWVSQPDTQIPVSDIGSDRISWLVVEADGEPVGVLRVVYGLPAELYKTYGYTPLVEGIDVEAFLANHKIAELGRLAILPDYRRHIPVVAALMRACNDEVIRRGFTHMLTEVLEGDEHSPYSFHTRVFGFKPVATHEIGELETKRRRITLLIDIREAYDRLKAGNSYIYRMMTEGWDEEMHARFGG